MNDGSSPAQRRYEQARQLLDRALDLPEQDRETFLEQSCRNDEVLLDQLRRLLSVGPDASRISIRQDLLDRLRRLLLPDAEAPKQALPKVRRRPKS